MERFMTDYAPNRFIVIFDNSFTHHAHVVDGQKSKKLASEFDH